MSRLNLVSPVGERDGLHELHPDRGRLLRDRVEGEQRHNSWFVLLVVFAVIIVLLIVFAVINVLLIVLLILVAVIIVLLIVLVIVVAVVIVLLIILVIIEWEKIDVCITWASLSSLLSSLSSLSSLFSKKSAQMRSMFLPRLRLMPSLFVQS